MNIIRFPYGKTHIEYDFKNEKLIDIAKSKLNDYIPQSCGEEAVKKALMNPTDSEPLSFLAKGKKNIVIIASDHTRPVPSKIIIPPMLEEIRKGNPDADITILIATGCHRTTTIEELTAKFGEEIVRNEKIVIHDCDDKNNLVDIGQLPSGGRLIINKTAYEADLLVSEGFIEPHFFAGFSGGRKSVLPGIAGRESVLANHCSEFIASPYARTGILEGNPIHRDMKWAAEKAGLKFIVNVVLNERKETVFAVAGNPDSAHAKGCDFLKSLCEVSAKKADIVISTNGGYPLDQNVYQSVKGMTAAEACVNEDGVIIMLSKSNDGHGGNNFFNQMSAENICDTERTFLQRNRDETKPDQWQSQIFIRLLKKAKVIYVSEMDDSIITKMHMIPAHSLDEAIITAKKEINKAFPSITAIPDGVSVIIHT